MLPPASDLVQLRVGKPYLWATWVAAMAAGDSQCQWAYWFRARHRYAKAPRDFDSAKWAATHAAAVRARAEELVAAGYVVYVEAQNSFTLRGQTAVVGGKPDIVAVRDDDALVVDVKTGNRRDEHWWQVLLYLYALPRTHPDRVGHVTLRGELAYDDARVEVDPSTLHCGGEAHLMDAIRRAAAEAPPVRVPSYAECRFCDIPASVCADRIDEDPDGSVSVDAF